MENIAEYLFNRRAPNLPPTALAEILDRLVWTMDDNGAEIHEAMRRWISSGDLEHAQVALACSEAFLYSSRQEIVQAFEQVCGRFPDLRRRCDEILAKWDRQHESPKS